MKAIIDLLKRPGIRLSAAYTWLLWDGGQQAWVVYHQAHRARRSTQVVVTSDEEQAVAEFARAAGIEIYQIGPGSDVLLNEPQSPQPTGPTIQMPSK
jgi:hypothetical protein